MSANPVKMTRTATVVEGLDLTVFTWELLHLEEHVKKVLCLRVKSFSLAPRPTAGRNVTFVDVRPRKVGTWPVACLPPHQKLFTGRQRTFLTRSLRCKSSRVKTVMSRPSTVNLKARTLVRGERAPGRLEALTTKQAARN